MKKLIYLIVIVLISSLVLGGCTLLSNISQVPATEQKGMPSSTANLVALWHFDDDALDSSGNNNDGTVYGASWVDGKLGNALSFDGTNDYVGIADSSILDITQGTWEAWIKFDTLPSVAGHPMNPLAKANQHWIHGSLNDTDSGTTDAIVVKIRVGGTRYCAQTSSYFITADVWYHVAGTYDGETLKLYVNGTLVNSNTAPSGDIDTGDQIMAVGTWSTLADYFQGTIDEVRIWDGALISAEILYSFENEILHVDDDWAQWPGAYYTINEALAVAGDGDTIIVENGIYTESLSLNKPVNLIGRGSSTTTIEAGVVGGSVITIDSVTDPMTIQGFTIDALNYGNERGICIQNVSGNITVEQNNVINFTENGILISNSNDNTIISNTITGSSTGSNAGVYVDNESGNNTIDSNTITLATSGTGNLFNIYFAGPTNSKNNTIMNNTINGGTRAFQQDGGVSGTTTISGNTINNPSWAGICLIGGSVIISGNTLTNTVRPIEFGVATNNVTITGNTIVGSTYDGINCGSASGIITITGNEICDSYRGIRVQTGCAGVDIINNNIHDNRWSGIELRAAPGEITGNTLDHNKRGIETWVPITAHHNDILYHLYGGLILRTSVENANGSSDATCNWWGSSSGPNVHNGTSWIGPGTGTSIITNGHSVNYNPWLTQDSSLVYTGAPQPDTSVVLEATLSDSTNGISGMDVKFYLNDIPVGNATTDSNGVARLDITGQVDVGVYEVYAKAACDLTSGTEYLAVYDPSAGFVTGGGWIDSPAGASAEYPDAVGKATFGFVSKYKKGATVPTGNTEFQFKAGDLNFHSDSYDWLVIAGDKAMYKGTGTINGTGNFGFMLSATDGDPDLFRIKIHDDGVIYDNQPVVGDGTELGGGQIIVHSGK